jgi:type IV secretion system protein TrbL
MPITRVVLALAPRAAPGPPTGAADQGCQWWNLACHGSTQVVDSGMSAITRSTASGTSMLLSEIVKTIDESTAVPLADPGYREIYYGFLGLAAPLIGVLLCGALILSALRRDAGTLGRAVVGLGVAGLGGALYIGLAQLLVALDDWLAQGIVRVTGQNLSDAITSMAGGFEKVAGAPGEVAANMLLIVLMLVMLLAGIILWFILVLRKIAILVVVAFAPLLIAGYLWGPTRPWVRKATEVLIALVFTKSAIYALFGIGLALLSRGTAQSLSDFVGTVVLLCGACFTPLLMLRLVHFAGDTHLAGDMIGNLRGGVQPVLNRMPHGSGHSASGRHDLARHQSHAPTPQQPGPEPSHATGLDPQPSAAGRTGGGAAAGGGSGGAAAGSTAGSAAGTRSAAAAGPVGVAAAGALVAGQATASAAKSAGRHAADAGNAMTPGQAPAKPSEGPSDPALRGPTAEQADNPRTSTDETGETT